MQTPFKISCVNDENLTWPASSLTFICYSGTVAKVKRARTVLQPLTPQMIACWFSVEVIRNKLAGPPKLLDQSFLKADSGETTMIISVSFSKRGSAKTRVSPLPAPTSRTIRSKSAAALSCHSNGFLRRIHSGNSESRCQRGWPRCCYSLRVELGQTWEKNFIQKMDLSYEFF